jgi:hypothetical protein
MEQRFWSKVQRSTDDECWAWLGQFNTNGYGVFAWTPVKHDHRNAYAHRVAWELTHDKIPEGLVVRHKCRGKCVNPAHLELGTQAENNRDMIRDDTQRRGVRNPNAVLTEEQVREIKMRLANYERGMCVALAAEYNVAKETITSLKKGRSWAWI